MKRLLHTWSERLLWAWESALARCQGTLKSIAAPGNSRHALDMAMAEERVLFNAVPVGDLLISTAGDDNNTGAPGDNVFGDSEIQHFGDPNLSYGSSTDGTFGNLFRLDNFAADESDIDALHYVTTAMTVGSGGNTFDLQAGDILFSTTTNENLTSTNTLNGYGENDVLVFRADTPGDYSSGTFYVLLENLGGTDVRGISLVEQTTTVGSTALQAGTFLFVRDGFSEENNVYHHTATGVGAGSTSGTTSILIDGGDVDVDQPIHSIELIETTGTYGGHSLQAGMLLLNSGDSFVGDNSLNVGANDIYALTVTQAGTNSAATASLFFDGSDVSLNTSEEIVDALTLITQDPAPVLDLDANNSGASGADFATTFTEDGGAVAIADSDATLSDLSDANLSSLTVTITNLLDGAAESLAANTAGTSIVANYNSGTGILTLSGSDTVANYQQVLRTITYNNTAQNPTTTARSITFVANDGTSNSNVGTTTVSMVAQDDAPVLDLDADNSAAAGSDFVTTFTEDGGAVGIADADATLSDVDTANFTSLTVTITNLLDGAAESLAANTAGTSIVANYNSGTGILTLSGSDTVANYQQVLRTITYNNTAQNPTTTARSITFVANDGTSNSNVGTTTVSMVAQDDAPVLDLDADNSAAAGSDFATTFTEDGGAVGIADADATLSDVDTANFTSLTVTITNLLDGAAESLAANTAGTSIVANYNSGTGILTLSGSDSVANYQQVLRTITYNNTAQNPTTTARSITFVANDGTSNSNVGTTTVSMVAQDDAPVLDLDADNSAAAGSDFATTFTEDGGAVGIADADATLSDVDTANFTSLTVTITNLLDGAAESLAANTAGTSIVANYNSGTGILTLSGSDTVANYQQVLRTITYNNTAQNPTTTARSITFVANDGTSNSNVGTTTVSMVAQDDAPVLDLDADNSAAAGSDFVTTFTEDGGAVGIADADATLSDVDTANFTSLTVTITNLLDGAAESLAANTAGTSIVANYNSGTGILTLSGSDTVANYQQVLRTITYNNTAQNPTTTARSITFVANDGTSNSNVGTTTVSMVAQDDAPVLDLDADNSAAAGSDFATTFTEDGGAVGIADADATLSDVDTANFTSLTVTITNLLDGAAESLAANTAGTSIVANYNSGTGILTLSGSDTVANYQQVLRTITYNNTAQNPTTTARSITFVANDGTSNSNVGTTTVSMVAQDDAPVLDLDADNSAAAGSDFVTTFTEDGGAVGIADADATLSDVDTANFTSLTVTITNLLDGAAESLAANTAGTSIVANYNSGTGILTLSGSDTVANYQQVLRTITYNNTAQNPTTTARSITFVANDGTSNSNVGTTTVSMVAQDDAPVLDLDADNSAAAGSNFATTFTEDGGAVGIADADATLSDVDTANFTSLTVTITNLLDGAAESLAANTAGTSIVANYNSGTGILTLSGSDSVANYQQVLRTITYNNTAQNPTTTARSITFVANDGTSNSNVGTTTVSMVAQDDAPVLDLDADNSAAAGSDFATTFTEDGGAVGIADADATLSDVDTANFTSLTVTITNLLDGAAESLAANTAGTSIVANYNSGTGILTLSGSDSVANYQQVLRTITYNNTAQNPTTTARSITFVANDGTSNSNVGTTTVSMVAQDDAPVLDLDADNSAAAGANFATTFTEGGGAVTIADADATLNDVDSANLSSLAVRITNLLDLTDESLSANTTGTSITANYNSFTGVLTLSGSDTVSNYQQVLRTISYNNISTNPAVTARAITFTANDGTSNSVVATATVAVVSQNSAPVAQADSFGVTAGEAFALSPATLLANDSDLDSSNLTVVLVGQPTYGTLVANADGSFTYTADQLFSGADSFSYQVSDGSTLSQVTTVTLNVQSNIVLPPVIVQQLKNTAESSEEKKAIEEALAGDGVVLTATAPANVQQPQVIVGPRIDRGDGGDEAVLQEVKNLKAVVDAAFGDGQRGAGDRSNGDAVNDDMRLHDEASGPVRLDGDVAGFDAALFWKELDSLQEEVQPSFTFDTTVVGTTAAVTTALSVGYVMWTLKGGYLMASALSSAPLWRMVDPLPVLHQLPTSRGYDEDGENDDSLQSMVENSKNKTVAAGA